MTGSTFLSVSPSLDFDCCSGADADADADADAGAGAVAETVNADTDTAGEDAAAPAVPVEFGASRAINAGPGIGPMSMVEKRWKEIGKWSPVQKGMRSTMTRATPFRLEMAMR